METKRAINATLVCDICKDIESVIVNVGSCSYTPCKIRLLRYDGIDYLLCWKCTYAFIKEHNIVEYASL